MQTDLGLDLHLLTARLDQAADRILRAEVGVSYRRYLALFMVGELGATTQRSLATHLGLTEPSVSRMTSTLAASGMLAVAPDPAGGNRRRLALTEKGFALVQQCRRVLDGRLTELLQASGVSHDGYTAQTRQLLAALEAGVYTTLQPPRGGLTAEKVTA
jgi:DNA-binding MarR family transcriptional regulator